MIEWSQYTQTEGLASLYVYSLQYTSKVVNINGDASYQWKTQNWLFISHAQQLGGVERRLNVNFRAVV